MDNSEKSHFYTIGDSPNYVLFFLTYPPILKTIFFWKVTSFPEAVAKFISPVNTTFFNLGSYNSQLCKALSLSDIPPAIKT